MAARLPKVNLEAIKTLVSVYGPRETSRQAGIAYGTIAAWCKRYGWKRAQSSLKVTSEREVSEQPIRNQTPSNALVATLQGNRERSLIGLAAYTAKAAEQAAKAKKPLEVARKVRDVAAVHATLWPAEKRTEIIQASILLNPNLVEESGGGGNA